MRKALKIAVVVSVQLALVAVGLEAVLRTMGPRVAALRVLLHQETVASEYMESESLPQLMAMTPRGFLPCREEHGFLLNSKGFRTGEYAVRPGDGARRVLLLGDSQTYAVVPRAYHWGTVLEEGLEARGGGPVEVLNLGVPSTGLPFYVRLWELEGRWLEPDLVLVVFYAGNDLVDGLGAIDPGSGPADWLAWKSHGFRALRNTMRIFRDAHAGAWTPPGSGTLAGRDLPCGTELPSFPAAYRDEEALFPPETYLKIEASRMAILHRSNARKLEDHLDQVRALFHRLAMGVQARGARLVVVVLPDEFQVDPELAAAAARFDEEPLALYDLDAPQRALKAIGASEGFEVLDPLSLFRSTGSRLYRPRETHLDRAGNRLFGEYLVDSLGSPDR